MRIRSVQCWAVVAPIKAAYEMAGGTHDAARCIVVQVETEDGLRGYGEAHQGVGGYGSETTATMTELCRNVYGPELVGCDADDISSVMSRLETVRIGNRFVKCAIEMALFDLLGKRLGAPIGLLLGGRVRTEAGLVGGLGFGEPEAVARQAKELVARGFTTVKLKVVGHAVSEDVELVQEVRRAIGEGIAIRVDGNEAYTLPEAVRFARGIEDADIELLEQPLSGWDLKGMAEIRLRSGIPVMSDESAETIHDIVRIGQERASDIVKIKIAKVGGFLPSLRIVSIAEAFGISVVVGHGMSIGMQATAEAHLIGAFANVNPVGEMTGPSRLADPVLDDVPDFSQPLIPIPTGPGLGVSVDPAVLDQYAAQ